MARKVEVEVIGDVRGIRKAFGQVDSASSKLGSSFGKVAKGAGILAGGAALGGLYLTLKTGISEFTEHSKVAAQTGAVLKSTGGAAHVTQKEIEGLAGSMMKKTGIDDEAIQSGENLLLTFTGIRNEAGKGNDVFNQTTSIMADLATATGKSMPAAATLLGKALNDPVTGMTKLSRLGINLGKDQQELIKHLAATGHAAEAQKIILGELEKRYGGSAEAAGKTLPGQLNILKETFNNVAGELIAKIIPTFKKFVDFITEHMPEIEATIGAVFTAIGWAWSHVLEPVLMGIIDAGKRVVKWFKDNWSDIARIFHEVVDPFKKVGTDIKEAIQKGLKGDWKGVAKSITTGLRDALEGAWHGLVMAMEQLPKLTDKIMDALGLGFLKDAVHSAIGGMTDQFRGIGDIILGILHGDITRVLKGIGEIFLGGLKLAATPFIAVGKAIAAFVETAFNAAVDFAGWVLGLIKDAVIKGATEVGNWGKSIVGWLKTAFLAAIDFPAWVLTQIGKAIMKGATTVATWATTIGGWLKTAFLTFVAFGAWIFERIGKAVMSGATTVAGWATTIGGWLKTAFLSAVAFGAWVFERIGKAVMTGAQTVAGWATTIGGWLKDAFIAFLDFGKWVAGKISAIGGKIGQAVGNAADTVKGWGSALGGWIESGFKSVLDFGGWLAGKISDGAGAVKKALTDLKDKIKGWLQKLFDWFSPSGMFEELGGDMMLGLAKGILDRFSDPRKAIKWVFGMVGKAVPDDFENWLKNVAGVGLGLAPATSYIQAADFIKKLLGDATSGVATTKVINKAMPDANQKEKSTALAAFAIAKGNYPYAVGGGRPGPGPSYGAPSWSLLGAKPVLGYDCSGAVSAIMNLGGFSTGGSVLDSGAFQSWGQSGYGKYISTIAYGGSGGSGHVYSVINPFGNWGTGANSNFAGGGHGGAGWGGSNSPGSVRHPFGSQGAGGRAAAMSRSSSGPSDTGFRFGPDAFDGDYGAVAARMMGPDVGFMGNSLVIGPDAAARFRGFAAGTHYAPGGWGMVGERGPELMYLPRGSSVAPHPSSSGAASGWPEKIQVVLDRRVITEVVRSELQGIARRNGTAGIR